MADGAIRDSGRAIRLVQISIPGEASDDRTAFSTTKREADRLIAASGVAHAIAAIQNPGCLRPASCRKRLSKRWEPAPLPSRTNGLPGCSCSRHW
jgi:uncharacterized protein YbjT (DUF2867 family)